MSTTFVNPLNLYGPMYPPSFEAMSSSITEDVQEMIDKSLEDVAFIKDGENEEQEELENG